MKLSPVVLNGVRREFGARILFNRLSHTCEPRTLTAITGASGSGKSTLLHCIGTLEDVNAGSIHIGDTCITGASDRVRRHVRRDVLGFLFQNYALVEALTVRENLAIAVGRTRRADRESEALDRVGLGGRAPEPVFQLSGGEQQRVALARLIVHSPRVILADEPTGALDRENADRVIAELRRCAAEGATVIIASHSPLVLAACESVIRLGPEQNPLVQAPGRLSP